METQLFEVEVKNRVVKGTFCRRIYGAQGNWYHEIVCCLAESEAEAEEFVRAKLRGRLLLGISRRRRERRDISREIEILNIRRIA